MMERVMDLMMMLYLTSLTAREQSGHYPGYEI